MEGGIGMKVLKILVQIGIIHLFLFMGIGLKMILPIPLPSSMIGLGLLLAALGLRLIKLEWIEQGANWLLAELLLFFIPSAVGIVNYDEVFGWVGLEMVALIILSTALVIGATAYTAELLSKERSVQE